MFAERRGLKASACEADGLEITTGWAEAHQQKSAVDTTEQLEHDRIQQQKIPAPLVAAITHYYPTIAEVARDNAMPHLEREIEHLQSMAGPVYQDPFSVALTFKGLILDDKTDKAELVKVVSERPEQYCTLRGKTGLFGDNAERKQALRSAQASPAMSVMRRKPGSGDWTKRAGRKSGSARNATPSRFPV